MKRSINLLFTVVSVLLAIVLLQSCDNKTMYDQSYDFKNGNWSKADTAVFVVDVTDIETPYDFVLTLRTTKEYLYSNLWTYILITSPDGSTSKVAQKIPLAYPDGSWIGKVSGTLVESSLRFDSKAFPMEGKYVFMITNATQEKEIPFVEDISLRIVEVGGR